jgi:hypothetical protein
MSEAKQLTLTTFAPERPGEGGFARHNIYRRSEKSHSRQAVSAQLPRRTAVDDLINALKEAQKPLEKPNHEKTCQKAMGALAIFFASAFIPPANADLFNLST